MLLTRFVRGQLWAFAIITVVSVGWILIAYLRVPSMVGFGRSTVELVLPSGAGLYPKSNVTYRGVHAGTVNSLRVDGDRVIVKMYLDSDLEIPKDGLVAEVHSRSAIGEQYVELLPTTAEGPYLEDGDVIQSDGEFAQEVRIPTQTTDVISTVEVALRDVPRDDLKTLIDESGVAFTNSGNDLQQILDGLNKFLDEGKANIEPTLNLIDNGGPLLQTQADSADSIRGWTHYLDVVTSSVAANDASLRGFLVNGQDAGYEASDLFTRITPTLPTALGNLNSVADVLRIYHMSLEQILAVYPPLAAGAQSVLKGANPGMVNLDFNLDVNAPPPCLTGFTPPDQRRSPADPTIAGDVAPNYCAVADGDPYVVRGARNFPCVEFPGVTAPDVDACRAGGAPVMGTNPWIGGP